MSSLFNIDWLEVYCIEDYAWCNKENMLRHGYNVEIKPYSTRVYAEVWVISTIFDEPLWTITRKPLSKILPEGSCHIKLANYVLYQPNFAQYFIKFLNEFQYQFLNITRIDVCADQQYFSCGIHPETLLKGYMNERYYKMNQPHFKLYGWDNDGIHVNSVQFGSKSSAIFSRMYNKTMELDSEKDKPYIRENWKRFGFDENKDVWRVEFQVKSPGRKRIKNGETISGEVWEITLKDLFDYPSIQHLFLSLAHKYWQWHVAETLANGNKQRRDRCKPLRLYDYTNEDIGWSPAPSENQRPPTSGDKRTIKYLCNEFENAQYSNKEREHIYHTLHAILLNKSLATWAHFYIDNLPSLSVCQKPSPKGVKSLQEVGLFDDFNNY